MKEVVLVLGIVGWIESRWARGHSPAPEEIVAFSHGSGEVHDDLCRR